MKTISHKYNEIGQEITMRQTKYEYLHVLQGRYGYGWEDLCASESRAEVRQNLKEYRENEGGCYRVIQRRVLREWVTV